MDDRRTDGINPDNNPDNDQASPAPVADPSDSAAGTTATGTREGTQAAPHGRRHRFTRPAEMRVTDPQKSHRIIRRVVDTLYPIGFLLISFAALLLLQWSVYPAYSSSQMLGIFLSRFFGSFVSGGKDLMMILNLVLLQLVYLFLLFLTNSFWASSSTFAILTVVIAVSERIKCGLRGEPVLLTDISLAAHNTRNVLSFIPPNAHYLIVFATISIIAAIGLSVLCAWFFGKARPLHVKNNLRRIGLQILLACVPAGLMTAFVAGTSTTTGWGRRFATAIGDTPQMWDAEQDSQNNGVLYTFIRNSFTTVMKKPAGYSKARMQSIARKYTKEAKKINATRQYSATHDTVIMVLSESFSDPSRVPGVTLSADPMPSLRAIENSTTSGLFLTSGYGGGTANREYQALTGLSTTNFDPSLNSPYQQIVPNQTDPFSFNQMWNRTGAGSVAFHPFSGGTYQRNSNYKKFRFRHFWNTDGPEYIKFTSTIGKNPYVSDAAAYKNVTEYLRKDTRKKQSFIQLATMQNHAPYVKNYYHNSISAANSLAPNNTDEKESIETYAQGLTFTDTATKDFLDQLDRLKRPVTVIWYGDHLPGIYQEAVTDPHNYLSTHETDYFIWSNKASRRQGTRNANAEYTSPNYLMAQAAEHMDTKVSPYLAFLTRMHQQIPAMQPAISATDWSQRLDNAIYLDSDGKRLSKLTATQKTMIKEYKLIAYDMTVGKGYLSKDGFLTRIPTVKTAKKPAAAKSK